MIFRIDDIGASAKRFEQHGRTWFTLFGKKLIYVPFANFWFFKRIWPFKRWGKYDELTAEEWRTFLKIFEASGVVPIVAVTAAWVDEHSNLIPFPEKFPEEAAVFKEAFLKNKIMIANHGLTHCVVGEHMPKFWSSNRSSWREFLPELDFEIHRDHILRSQEILENFFEKPIDTLVPPGNVWSHKTYEALSGTNIRYIRCNATMQDSGEKMKDIVFLDDRTDSFVFHDRELKLYGSTWLIKQVRNA